MTRLHVWFDGCVTAGMRGAGDSCVGHGGMLGIFTLGGVGAYGILGGRGSVGTLGSGGAVGNLGGRGSVVTGTLGGRAERPDQRVIVGVVRVAVLGMGMDNCMILDNFISACVCSMPNFVVCEAGCGCWRAAMRSWIDRVIFLYGGRPGRTYS